MGLFDKFKEGLSKTRDFFSQQVSNLSAKFGVFNEEELEELEMLMIASDMGVKTTDKLMDELRSRMQKEGNKNSDFVLKTLKDEMREILGTQEDLVLDDSKLNIIVMVGVNGSGKTTSAAKLAKQYKDEGKKVILSAADTFRAAAIEQLEEWANRTNVPIISQKQGTDPAAVVYDSIASAKANDADVLIIDTAGRLHTQKNLMDELEKVIRIVKREAPEANKEILLVFDATSGQNAVIQTEQFSDAVDVTGLILTKLDGSAKGGVALAVSDIAKKPIYFAGLGEQIDDLVSFNPDYFIDSLLPEDLLEKNSEN